MYMHPDASHNGRPEAVPPLVAEILPLIGMVMGIGNEGIRKRFEDVLGPLVKMLTPTDYAKLIILLCGRAEQITYVTVLSRQEYSRRSGGPVMA